MSAAEEVLALEERLRLAELGPDPTFFEEFLADDAVLDGHRAKARVVAAHQPGSGVGQKFTRVEMSDFQLVEHGPAVVLTCSGFYESEKFTGTLRFMRVWLKTDGKWRIIAGSMLQ